MYKITVNPNEVNQTLNKYVLADGYDFTYDMEKSHGVYMYDSKGQREMLDFFTCFASVPLGYNHPKMLNDDKFLQNLLLAAIANPSNSDVYTQQYAQFVETMAKVALPKYMKHMFFVAGGALAVENALKTAMDWKVQKNFEKGYRHEKGFKVLHFEHAFHGRSGYTLSLTNTLPEKTKWFAKFDWPRVSVPEITWPIEKHLDEIKARESQSLAQVKRAFEDNKDDICAIIIEPVLSEGGDKHVRAEFLEQLRKIADENDALLIYDEVQTGVGLSGKFWCHQHFGAKAQPDIIAFGKKMQVCGILAGPRIDEISTNVFKVPSRINSTWGGNLVDMVRADQIMRIIKEDDLCANAEKSGAYLLKQLHKLAEKSDKVSNVRGKGLLCAFDLPDGDMRTKFLSKGLDNNVLFLGCGTRSIRFRPALQMEKKHIDQGVEVMEEIIKAL